jgi:hypothetical protein
VSNFDRCSTRFAALANGVPPPMIRAQLDSWVGELHSTQSAEKCAYDSRKPGEVKMAGTQSGGSTCHAAYKQPE